MFRLIGLLIIMLGTMACSNDSQRANNPVSTSVTETLPAATNPAKPNPTNADPAASTPPPAQAQPGSGTNTNKKPQIYTVHHVAPPPVAAAVEDDSPATELAAQALKLSTKDAIGWGEQELAKRGIK